MESQQTDLQRRKIVLGKRKFDEMEVGDGSKFPDSEGDNSEDLLDATVVNKNTSLDDIRVLLIHKFVMLEDTLSQRIEKLEKSVDTLNAKVDVALQDLWLIKDSGNVLIAGVNDAVEQARAASAVPGHRYNVLLDRLRRITNNTDHSVYILNMLNHLNPQ